MEIKKYLDYELQDDETEIGGVSFQGETLENFLSEVGTLSNYEMAHINDILVECGIKKIVQSN